ncbi:MAG: hypothetical protein QM754_17435 [Tepidisphaeraceae bacterium]
MDLRAWVLSRMATLGWSKYRLMQGVAGRVPRTTLYSWLSGKSDINASHVGVVLEVLDATLDAPPPPQVTYASMSEIFRLLPSHWRRQGLRKWSDETNAVWREKVVGHRLIIRIRCLDKPAGDGDPLVIGGAVTSRKMHVGVRCRPDQARAVEQLVVGDDLILEDDKRTWYAGPKLIVNGKSLKLDGQTVLVLGSVMDAAGQVENVQIDSEEQISLILTDATLSAVDSHGHFPVFHRRLRIDEFLAISQALARGRSDSHS